MTWDEDRLAAAKSLVLALEAGIIALSSGQTEYSYSTGQSTVRVTKSDVGSLQKALQAALQTVDLYERRVSGEGGLTYVR